VGIDMGYELNGRISVPGRDKRFCLFSTASRPALGPTQPPIQSVLGALSPVVKRPGREADHPPPPQERWSFSSTLPYIFIAWCLIGDFKNPIINFLFLGVGWDWVHSVRRPLIGLLYQPRMIDDDERGAVSGMGIGRGNLRQCHFVHHKCHMSWPGIETGPPRWEARG
jgi:hypothetical protein